MTISLTANLQSPPASRIGATNRARRPLISLTPLIDVVFILLVFFMLASSFLQWRVIDINVPGSGGPVMDDLQKVRIDIYPDALQLGAHRVAPDEIVGLIGRLYGDGSDIAVALRSMPDTHVQAIVTTLDHLAEGGITNVTLVAAEAE
ncbi:MAG TPA: biopolymer transporter ExbD [Alphaproteobacteria bacterium]|jgi:biopolymer transport protein ExbD|nr:biopolymer transporter ExbD [Alphaproteobacteria bacterium]HAM46549.1 biopolymer transporter ExbD [Alphaproteobacteria bacterium]HBC53590.1 biopolymer transporter ExbD [Alphaproteobacteria bacterium]HBF98836.1 biopolymer transporter ExbD [Alphaproteobacteria bacterium]HCO91667.1 biopolymer transporter ExbD [Alphaproteobacteria bacterium]